MGLTIMTKKALAQHVAAAQRIANLNSGGTYDGKELMRNPGITDARFEAYRLPSRVAGKLVYPKERT
jgi:hypothetical protein